MFYRIVSTFELHHSPNALALPDGKHGPEWYSDGLNAKDNVCRVGAWATAEVREAGGAW